jgi:hypothetical protein
MIVLVRSHIGIRILDVLAALGLSILLFKPKWKACIEAGPRSWLSAAALVIGLLALAIVSR